MIMIYTVYSLSINKNIIIFSEKRLHFEIYYDIILFVVMVCADDCIPLTENTSCAHTKEGGAL